MKLLIDAGNTRIKWALADEEGSWVRSGILPVAKAGELPGLFAEEAGIRQVFASNVAGDIVAQPIRDIGAGKAIPVELIVARKTQCGVSNSYPEATRLGSDRWAALIAAWHLAKERCLVVNCGTAITIDTLSEQGVFLGGLILPGFELMQHSLVTAANQLRPVKADLEHAKYERFPLNTGDALVSGAIQAACGAIERQFALLEDGDAAVILSGGSAGILQEHLNLRLRVVDNLVLQGLMLISQESEIQ